MLRRQFIVTGIASSVLASTKLHGFANAQGDKRHTASASRCKRERAARLGESIPATPRDEQSLLRRQRRLGVVSHHHARRKHPHQQQPRTKRPSDSGQHRKTRLQIQRHKNPPHQPRPLGSLRRQRQDHPDDRREIYGDDRRRPRRRVRRQKRFSLRQRPQHLVSANEGRSAAETARNRKTWWRRACWTQNRRPHQGLHHMDYGKSRTTKRENRATSSSSAAPTSTPATNS